eukprot:GABW01000013.1.p3 GENE.GABW01000013.1~~GABW01000013.1.p3  ORF type:complete len:50 (+),score=0.06 GABW01000013.1:80-229(+)
MRVNVYVFLYVYICVDVCMRVCVCVLACVCDVRVCDVMYVYGLGIMRFA